MSCHGNVCGGQSQANVNDEHVVKAFRDAIANHNQTANDHLEFVKVVSATQQVVAGMRFRGLVEVTGGSNNQYDVDVWVKPGTQGIEVMSCAPHA
ncbi:hypothetical protein M9Y10_034672 [Tritrichomonas musculus]|uniref:Cystatin domain-containing protein n=1 Tax=Tritrichomonas musculus TaxID=1915356 RepID=A0ABR2KGH0_9EUKA